MFSLTTEKKESWSVKFQECSLAATFSFCTICSRNHNNSKLTHYFSSIKIIHVLRKTKNNSKHVYQNISQLKLFIGKKNID